VKGIKKAYLVTKLDPTFAPPTCPNASLPGGSPSPGPCSWNFCIGPCCAWDGRHTTGLVVVVVVLLGYRLVLSAPARHLTVSVVMSSLLLDFSSLLMLLLSQMVSRCGRRGD